MPKTVSINQNSTFRRLFYKGAKATSPFFVINYMPFLKYEKLVRYKKYKYDIGNNSINQLGIITSKKLGNAVVRNKLKRQIREIYRYYSDKIEVGSMVVVVAKANMIGAEYSKMRGVFGGMLKKLNLFADKSE